MARSRRNTVCLSVSVPTSATRGRKENHSPPVSPLTECVESSCPSAANNENAEVVEVSMEDPVPSEKTDPISLFNLDDVLLSATPVTQLSTNRKTTLTKLHSIGSVPIANIGVRQLKLFCTRVGIVGAQKFAKQGVVDAIISAKSSTTFVQLKDRVIVDVDKEKADTAVVPNKRSPMNRRRLLNVLFGDVVRPELATLGATLTREEMDEGKKQDQVFFELVVVEYNKKGVMSYDANAFDSIPCGKYYLPSNFTPIDWKKARESFKSLCNE